MSNSMTMSQFAVLALCFLWGVRGLRTDNPPMQLGKTAVKTVGQLARTQVKGQGFKGFKGFKGTGFQFKPDFEWICTRPELCLQWIQKPNRSAGSRLRNFRRANGADADGYDAKHDGQTFRLNRCPSQ